MTAPRVAGVLTDMLNPFFIFTALYALVAFVEAGLSRGLLYLTVELVSAAAVAGYVLLMRRRQQGSPPLRGGFRVHAGGFVRDGPLERGPGHA